MNFKTFLELFTESTAAGDVAGVGAPLGKGKSKECPCKKDPESEECKKIKLQKQKQPE